MEETVQPASRGELPRREAMQTPEEVAAMLRLKALGWGVRRIAGELGCSHMTVRRYLAEGGWVAYRGRGRPRTLSGLEEWVAERFRRHAGNADVVRQELEREKGIRLTLRTVEREVRHLRRELEAEARATIRFETPPGRQLQIDFGERRVAIGDENVKAYLFVATLGYSRRLYVRAFRNERQESWFAGVEARSATSAGSPKRCCSTMIAGWWCVMTGRPERSSSMPGCTPLPSIGVFGLMLVPPTGRAPKGKTSAASAM
jgi:transposase